MNYTRINTVGVDRPIQRLQTALYNYLSGYFDSLNGYGRVHKNVEGEYFKLETHVSKGEYEDVLRSDDSRFFFYLHNSINYDVTPSAKVDVFFMVDLMDYSTSPERLDEEILARVNKVINGSQFKIIGIEKGIDYLNQILKGGNYDPTSRVKNIQFEDMQPYHVFCFKCEVQGYSLQICD